VVELRQLEYFLAVGPKPASVQGGQAGQPSPLAISRTAPPVTTMSPLATALGRARPRRWRGIRTEEELARPDARRFASLDGRLGRMTDRDPDPGRVGQ
jgi:hypothetical protein